MIDFAQVKTITIPKGEVKEIRNQEGVVLWSAAEPLQGQTTPQLEENE